MKKNLTLMFALMALMAMVVACNKQAPKMDEKKANVDFPQEGMKIVYVDLDSLMKEYNFAKDNAVLLDKAEQEVLAAGNEAQKLKENIEYKLQKNVYTSQEQFEQDQRVLERKAQAYMQKQEEFQNMRNKFLTDLQDSLDSFIEIYNKDKQYDMILNSATLLHRNPKFDVTHDVANGMNNRYKKQEAAPAEEKEKK